MEEGELFDIPFDDSPDEEKEARHRLHSTVGIGDHHRVVVFADMLGFSHLTEAHPVESDLFEELQRPSALEFLRATLEEMDASPLSERFIRFHLILQEAVRHARQTADGASIAFSDCAFYATATLANAFSYSIELVQACLASRIPLRVGIAWGEFLVVRSRSDIGMANQDYAMQFLGSGVTRAHAAEHCGVKGIRILLHPSLYPILDNDTMFPQHSE